MEDEEQLPDAHLCVVIWRTDDKEDGGGRMHACIFDKDHKGRLHQCTCGRHVLRAVSDEVPA